MTPLEACSQLYSNEVIPLLKRKNLPQGFSKELIFRYLALFFATIEGISENQLKDL